MNRLDQQSELGTRLPDPPRADTQSADTPAIPEHQLEQIIASGAYGEVWLGRSVLGTPRAVKVVRRDQHSSIESFEREFKGLQKFEPVSRSHEGLVDILTLGLLPDDVGFYYVMELADGSGTGAHTYAPRTLRAELKARGSMPAEEVVALGLKLASALAHLHAHGLVHRDVKPSNILFIAGVPKLADAGLVAAVDDARSLVGTAGYIAPEGPGTPQADLYALGKVLYEAAFGKDRREFPALPSDVASSPCHACLLELNEIIATACAHDPRRRYATADEILAELKSLQSGRSVRRLHVWQRALKSGKKFAFVGTGLAIAAILYWLALKKPRPAEIEWSKNEEANQEYREGVRALHAENDDDKAIKHFNLAIAKDPAFAEAYARLAVAWMDVDGSASITNSQLAAEKALLLNPKSAVAHTFLGVARMSELDWAGAERERKQGVALSPHSEEVLLASAMQLATMGRTNEALETLDTALRSNPDDASKMRAGYEGFVYAWTRQYDRAIEHYKQNPYVSFWEAEQYAQVFVATGDYTNAIRLEKLAALGRGGKPDLVNAEFNALERAFKEGGPEKYWSTKLGFESLRTGPLHPTRMAAIYARLNQRIEAFQWLDRAKQEAPHRFSLEILTNPSFDSLRTDQRFAALLKELWREK